MSSYYTTKPPYGAKPNRNHPWLVGCQGLYALNEGAGGTVYDSMQQLNLSATGFESTSPWGVGSGGGLSLSNAASQGALGTLPVSLKIQYPCTLIAAFRYVTAGNGAALLSVAINNTGTSPYGLASLQNVGGGTNWYTGYQTSGNTWTNGNSFAISENVDHVFGASFGNGAVQTYLDGKPQTTNGVTFASTVTYAATACLGMGLFSNFSFKWAGIIYWGCLFSSALPPSVHAEIGAGGNPANIWQVFPRRQASYYQFPTFQPWIYGDQVQEMYG